MKILIVSDAWHPQINGVVRTLEATAQNLRALGHDVCVTGPQVFQWNTVSAPSYPAIKLEFFGHRRIRRVVHEFQPDFIHIATEGPLGWAARNFCLRQRLPFTTSYHTRFPEYLAARAPQWLAKVVRLSAYAGLRRFHAPSSAIMVSTASIEKDLRERKFRRIVRWSRGVDTDIFRPYAESNIYADLLGPILLYVGRVAVEKNLCAFLEADTSGTKIVIGEGPDLARLKAAYPKTQFLGPMQGERLAHYYSAADLFVFPSTTDTFGLVLLEACAAGLRIAAYPAPGPVDIFAEKTAHAFVALDTDLTKAICRALALPRNPALPRAFVERFSWQACTCQFYDHLQASTPNAVKRITRFRNWLSRHWQHALALSFK